MNKDLDRLVRQRAHDCCEYCKLSQAESTIEFEIDHIVARKHGGRTRAGNLALTCVYCNSFKGPNLSGIDPRSKRLVRLFHPRRHRWDRHFRWQGAILEGRTPVGRATIAVLKINLPTRVAIRQMLG